ncbi:hypothetical protein [Acetobacterium tundrae]|uniref:Uncharacterized protein n=1 Tax=Acetobacterium tundrae TaxID=132932 RepID=A0ABR6WIW3_9FIRM|nr:hypothetical protein [Acetobacterium tundrae]MBC3796092.1 hypothetical protein [Acetobacterium tundrae]
MNQYVYSMIFATTTLIENKLMASVEPESDDGMQAFIDTRHGLIIDIDDQPVPAEKQRLSR